MAGVRRRGLAIGASEAETFWVDFLRKLALHGLCGVKLVISTVTLTAREW
jgi:transposase-like protein